MLLFVYFVIFPLFSSSSFQFCTILGWTLTQLWNCLCCAAHWSWISVWLCYSLQRRSLDVDYVQSDLHVFQYVCNHHLTRNTPRIVLWNIVLLPFVGRFYLFSVFHTHTNTIESIFFVFCNLSFFSPFFQFWFDFCLTWQLIQLWNCVLCPLVLDQCFLVATISMQTYQSGIRPKWPICLAVRFQPPLTRSTHSLKTCCSFLFDCWLFLFLHPH